MIIMITDNNKMLTLASATISAIGGDDKTDETDKTEQNKTIPSGHPLSVPTFHSFFLFPCIKI